MSFSKRKDSFLSPNDGLHQPLLSLEAAIEASVPGVTKYVPLVVYILIFSVHSILVKTTGRSGSYDYDPCLIIILAECMKGGLCLAMYVRETGSVALQSIAFAFVRHDWRMAGPALLLSVGNNLGFYNLLYYDPQMYMILMNATRILVTAFFWTVLFGERITPRTWMACGTLTIGCVLANIDCASDGSSRFGTQPRRSLDWLGQLTILLQASISSLSSVYSELLLKHGSAEVRPNLARQNLVLAGFSLVVNCVYLGSGAGSGRSVAMQILRFDVLFISILLALGGLCASLVLKRFSALTKAYATACEILLTGALAAIFLNSNLHVCFWLSFGFISSALVMYSKNGSEQAARPPRPTSLAHALCPGPPLAAIECHGPFFFIEDERLRGLLYAGLLSLSLWAVVVPAQLMRMADASGLSVSSIPAMQMQLGVEFVEPATATSRAAALRAPPPRRRNGEGSERREGDALLDAESLAVAMGGAGEVKHRGGAAGEGMVLEVGRGGGGTLHAESGDTLKGLESLAADRDAAVQAEALVAGRGGTGWVAGGEGSRVRSDASMAAEAALESALPISDLADEQAVAAALAGAEAAEAAQAEEDAAQDAEAEAKRSVGTVEGVGGQFEEVGGFELLLEARRRRGAQEPQGAGEGVAAQEGGGKGGVWGGRGASAGGEGRSGGDGGKAEAGGGGEGGSLGLGRARKGRDGGVGGGDLAVDQWDDGDAAAAAAVGADPYDDSPADGGEGRDGVEGTRGEWGGATGESAGRQKRWEVVQQWSGSNAWEGGGAHEEGGGERGAVSGELRSENGGQPKGSGGSRSGAMAEGGGAMEEQVAGVGGRAGTAAEGAVAGAGGREGGREGGGVARAGGEVREQVLPTGRQPIGKDGIVRATGEEARGRSQEPHIVQAAAAVVDRGGRSKPQSDSAWLQARLRDPQAPGGVAAGGVDRSEHSAAGMQPDAKSSGDRAVGV